MLIDELIYNKVLYYPDSNSKLKVIKGKVSTKNIIPDTKILYMVGLLISLIPKGTHLCVKC